MHKWMWLAGWIFCVCGLQAQSAIEGKITDEANGEALVGANIALFRNGILITGTDTDDEGNYAISNVDPGTYDVEFSYTGYQGQRQTGVIICGSFIAALWGGELKLEGFKDGHSMRRYIAGAVCMGFGGMLAGGCAVGAGISGAAIFALTAWLALIGIWLGGGLTNWLVDRPHQDPPGAREPAGTPAPQP